MIPPRPRAPRVGRSSALLGFVLLLHVAPTHAGDPVSPAAWSVSLRTVTLVRTSGVAWQIDYWLRNDSAAPIALRFEDLSARVEGYVSNSRVPTHACPRRSALTVLAVSTGVNASPASCDVIPSSDESHRCRERGTLRLWAASKGDQPPTESAAPVIPAGETLRVRLTLEHDHFLYGPYNALLGARDLELKLATVSIRDPLPLDQEPKLPRTLTPAWPALGDPPADRVDTRVFTSAPHSLHLEAHIPGNQSFRFKECAVPYGTRMRLRYWYLIAPGTEGQGKSRLVQYKDSPTSWKILSDGDIDQYLPTIGRWTRVERTFRTESEATTLTLEFRLPGDIGEMWIDDVSLEPVDDDPSGP